MAEEFRIVEQPFDQALDERCAALWAVFPWCRGRLLSLDLGNDFLAQFVEGAGGDQATLLGYPKVNGWFWLQTGHQRLDEITS